MVIKMYLSIDDGLWIHGDKKLNDLSERYLIKC